MSKSEEYVEDRLRKLGQATLDIAPAAGFDAWVLEAVERQSGVVWFDTMWRTGRVALLVGALAAAASVVLAWNARTDLDEAVLATFEMVEFSE